MEMESPSTNLESPGSKLGSYGAIDIRQESVTRISLWGAQGHLEDAPWWSRLIFYWMSPLLDVGYREKKMTFDDLDAVPLPSEDGAEYVFARFAPIWNKEKKKAEKFKDDPSLSRTLWLTVYPDFSFMGMLKLVHVVFLFVGPYVLYHLIYFMRNSSTYTTWYGLRLVAYATFSQVFLSLALRHYQFLCTRVELQVRSSILMALHEKAVVTTHYRTSEEETKRLASVDLQRVQAFVAASHFIWYGTLQATLAVVFLWILYGTSSLVGLFFMAVSVPTAHVLSKWSNTLYKDFEGARDMRVEATSTMVKRIKVIKMEGWEGPYKKQVEFKREIELEFLRRYQTARVIGAVVREGAPLLSALFIFVWDVLAGRDLDVAPALSALVVLELLKQPLVMALPCFKTLVDASAALKNIAAFLVGPDCGVVGNYDDARVGVELKDVTVMYDSKIPARPPKSKGVGKRMHKELTDADWEMTRLKSQIAEAEMHLASVLGRSYSPSQPDGVIALSRVSLSGREGELIVVVGGPGSGTSTLLKAILGDVQLLSGELGVNGKLAYHPQTPYIMNDSIKNNILLGHGDWENAFYGTALTASGLEKSLEEEEMEDGDSTEISDGGAALSKKMLTHISMARVLCRDADVNLLDDPLVGLDPADAKALFDECIVDTLLAGKGNRDGRKPVVIMTTSSYECLSHSAVTRVVVLKGGKVAESGSYFDLQTMESSELQTLLSNASDTSGSPGGSPGGATPPVKVQKPISMYMEGSDSNEATAQDFTLVQSFRNFDDSKKTATPWRLPYRLFMSWAKFAGGFWVLFLIPLVYVVAEGLYFFSNWWLYYWSTYGLRLPSQRHYLGVYSNVVVVVVILWLTRSATVLSMSLRTSRKAFDRLLDETLRLRLPYFDQAELNKLLGVFGTDVGTVDEHLAQSIEKLLCFLLPVFVAVVVTSVVTPFFLLLAAPLAYLYYVETRFISGSNLALARLVSSVDHPSVTFAEALGGGSVIRAFSSEATAKDRMTRKVDMHQHAVLLLSACQDWLALRMDFIAMVVVFGASFLPVIQSAFFPNTLHFSGLAGVSFFYALVLARCINWVTLSFGELEGAAASLNSVADALDQDEARLEVATPPEDDTEEIPEQWPSKGGVEFQKVKMVSQVDMVAPTLDGVSFSVPAGTTVGVVGTSAGSAIATAMSRYGTIDEGSVLIDGVDTKYLPLKQLRDAVAIVPADPLLVAGTVRSNLDPLKQYDDEILITALEKVGLMSESAGFRTLSDAILDGGSDLSAGTRQVFVAARALLKGASILVIEEDVAGGDNATMHIRKQFPDCSCFIIATTLDTLLGCDSVLVMKDGQLVEFDTPANLQNQDGYFSSLSAAWNEAISEGN